MSQSISWVAALAIALRSSAVSAQAPANSYGPPAHSYGPPAQTWSSQGGFSSQLSSSTGTPIGPIQTTSKYRAQPTNTALPQYPDCPQGTDGGNCVVYARDFKDGGTYFQNVNSTKPFSFNQNFEGCDKDTSYNLLVDPDGDQRMCTDTNLQPDGLNMRSRCPTNKDELTSGEWSILVISNNGACKPIAYQRDFSLTVGTQKTTTYTPTVYFTNTSTPLSEMTSTQTIVTTATIPGNQTIVVPSLTKSRTRTVTPSPTTVTGSRRTMTRWTYTVVVKTITDTASCIEPTRAPYPDPTCKLMPTLPVVGSIVSEIIAPSSLPLSGQPGTPWSGNYGPPNIGGHTPEWPGEGTWTHAQPWSNWNGQDKAKFVQWRKAKLAGEAALRKRGPDRPTKTITETNSDLFVTSSATATGSPVLITRTIYVMQTATVTSGIYRNRTTTTLPPATVTKQGVTFVWSTKTLTPTVHVISTPPGALETCKANGGNMFP